jgi:hypothetical protein
MARFAAPLAGIAALFAVALPAQAQTLTNGDFSTFSVCPNCSNGSGYSNTQQVDGSTQYSGTANNLSGWTTTAGYAFVVTPSQAISGFTGPAGSVSLWSPTANSPYAPYGSVTGNGGSGSIPITGSPTGSGNFLVVDPSYQNTYNSLPASTYTTLTNLVNGATYTVSFYAAAAQQHGFSLSGSGYSSIINNWTVEEYTASGSAPACANITGESCQVAPAITAANQSFSGWVQQQVTFVAAAATMTLAFIASSNVTSSQPPMALLDNVSITQNSTSTPEPAAAALLLSGLAGLVAARRRGRAKA